jgi:hypothetical protein
MRRGFFLIRFSMAFLVIVNGLPVSSVLTFLMYLAATDISPCDLINASAISSALMLCGLPAFFYLELIQPFFITNSVIIAVQLSFQ